MFVPLSVPLASGTFQGRGIRLTKAATERAWKGRGAKRQTLRDDAVKGLALVVNATSASWVFSYKPQGRDDQGRRWPTRHMRLGGLDTLDLDAARQLAGTAKLRATAGGDPAPERSAEVARETVARARERTVAEALTEYVAYLDRQDRSAKHRRDEKRQARQAVELAGMTGLPLAEVRKGHVLAVLDRAAGAALPGKLFGSLCRFLAWAVDRDMLASNPCLEVDRRRRPKPPVPRSRVLSLVEVARLWHAAGSLTPRRGEQAGGRMWCRLVRFALLVPARINELSRMEWTHVDLGRAVWVQPGRLTKNGEEHTFPLPPAAVEILSEQWGDNGKSTGLGFAGVAGRPFTSWAVLLRRLHEESGVVGWSWHDLRRTVVSHLAENGVAESVADGLLNHRQSATRSGVLGVYQRASRLADRRHAMELWATLIARAVADMA